MVIVKILLFACVLSVFFLFVCVLFLNTNNKDNKEGFEWSSETACRYKKYIKTFNPTYRFNIETIEKNASEDEINYLINNNRYIWSEETKKMFLDNVSKNQLIRIDPLAALWQSMNVYPESIMKKKLFWDTNQGKFILNGGIINNTTQQLPENVNNTIKCEVTDNGEAYMYKKIIDGIDIYSGYERVVKEKVKNEDIPKIMTGFSFINE